MGGLDLEPCARQNQLVCDELHTHFGVVRSPQEETCLKPGGGKGISVPYLALDCAPNGLKLVE
jgi:hypothetical protein